MHPVDAALVLKIVREIAPNNAKGRRAVKRIEGLLRATKSTVTIVELLSISFEGAGRGVPASIHIPAAEDWVGKNPPSLEVMNQVALVNTKSKAFARAFAGGAGTYWGRGRALVEARYPDLDLYLKAPFR